MATVAQRDIISYGLPELHPRKEVVHDVSGAVASFESVMATGTGYQWGVSSYGSQFLPNHLMAAKWRNGLDNINGEEACLWLLTPNYPV